MKFRKIDDPAYLNAKDSLKRSAKRFNWRLALKALLEFLFVFFVYHALNAFQLTFHLYLYPILICVLAVAYFFLNGGTFGKNDLTEADLPKEWEEEKKAEFLAKHRRRQKWARELLPVLFAFLLTVMLDLVWLNFFDSDTGIFGQWSPFS